MWELHNILYTGCISAGSKLYVAEVTSLNGTVERRPQVNLRSRARCMNTLGRGVQPDQWHPGTGALDLRLTWGLLATVLFKEATSGLHSRLAGMPVAWRLSMRPVTHPFIINKILIRQLFWLSEGKWQKKCLCNKKIIFSFITVNNKAHAQLIQAI